MADLSLIPQNRIKDLSTTFDGCVHTTGNETISGIKTFTDTPIVLKSGSSEMIIKSSDKDSTVTPESNYQVGHYVIADKNNRRGGYWYCEKRNDGSVRNSLETRRYLTDGTYKHGAVEVWQNANDQCYCTFGGAGTNLSLSGADSSTSSNIIPTKGWVNNPATSTNVVHRSGNETIEGSKVLLNNLVIKNSNIEQLTNPDSYSERGLFAYDKNNVRIGSIGFSMNTNGASRTYIESSKVIDGTATYGLIESYTDLNGNHSYYIGGNLVKGFVTTTYQSGTNWYRVWSDGWIEQGGRGSITSSGLTVTFLKAFSDANYTLLSLADRSSAGSVMDGVGLQVLSKATNNFKIANKNYGSSNTVDGWWYACGY